MANIPLQSISFPGLSDKYTTPTVDATLTQTGAAADAKKTGDEIAGLKNDFTQLEDKVEDAYNAYVVETETGSIASFTDGADDVPVKDLTVAINPVQSGSGDPSPENIRPISGWTGAKVTRTGKNLMRLPTINEINNAETIVSYKSVPIQLEPNTTYYLSTTFLNGYTAKDKGFYALVTPNAYDNNDWEAFAHTKNDAGKEDGKITTSESGKLYLRFFNVTEQQLNELYANAQIQLEKGSTATAYEPYQGETYEVDWTTEAGTVYGGTLDVTTGKLVVNHALLAVNDSATIARQVGRTDYYFNVVASGLPVSEINTGIISNVLKPLPFGGSSGIWQGNEGCCLREGMFTFYANATKNMELNEAKQWLIDNEAEIYCPLANPVTYQLTPQEVRTLLGQNNIFADCGDVTAQYRADTKLYIDKVLNA